MLDEARIERVVQRSERTSVYAQYTIMVCNRDIMQLKLNSVGIPTAIHYPIPINEQIAYKNSYRENRTPIASQLAKKVISLPMSPYMEREDQNKIIDMVIKFEDK